MTTPGNQFSRRLKPLIAVASVALLGLSLAACSPASTDAPSESSPVAVSESAAPATAAPAKSAAAVETTAPPAAATERKVTVKVTGAKDSALVKSLVVTNDDKETDGEMVQQTLPYTQEFSLPAGATFTKILVLAKYPSGGTGEISCTVTVDGKEVATNSSSNHEPAKCLFVEKDTK